MNSPFISLFSVPMDVINCFKTKVGSSLKPSDAKFFILSVDFECQGRTGSACALQIVSDSIFI